MKQNLNGDKKFMKKEFKDTEFMLKRRQDYYNQFNNFIDEIVVLSDNLKKMIKANYYNTNGRMYEEIKVRQKEWDNITTETMFKDWYKVEANLKSLNIFSDTFIQNVYSHFYLLIQSWKQIN